MSTIGKRRRHATTSSPNESDDNDEKLSTSTSLLSKKRRSSVAADFASQRLIVSERQQMAVLKQLTAGEESNLAESKFPQVRPSKINRRNEHGETIVHINARKGDLKQLRKVLKAGANVNEADNAGWTPLHEAVTKNQYEAARLLLKSGANSNASGPEGQTPLLDAVHNNNIKMVQLLLKYSANPSGIDFNRVNETMLNVLNRETTELDSSENENGDELMSPLSPLTSDNECEQDDKQHFHSILVEEFDKNLSQHSKFQQKSYRHFRECSSQSSDSLLCSKTRTISGSNGASLLTSKEKNPYDFESEEDSEVAELTNEKKTLDKQDNSKQRANSGNPDNSSIQQHSNKIELIKDKVQNKSKSTSDDEQLQHIHRVPPLKIVLARTNFSKTSNIESLHSLPMDNNDLTMDSSSSSLSMPIIEQTEKLLSSMSSNTTVETNLKEDEQKIEVNKDLNSHLSNLDRDENFSVMVQSQSIISIILDTIITKIETNTKQNLNVLSIIEEKHMEIEEEEEDNDDDDDDGDDGDDGDDDDDDGDDGDDDDGSDEGDDEDDNDEAHEQETIQKNLSKQSLEVDQERATRVKHDFKPTTRTLRSQARAKINLSTIMSNLSNRERKVRRVSSRRQTLERKLLIMTNKKKQKRKTNAKQHKDNTTNNDDVHTSSNSDDQIMENTNVEKLTHATANPNDDASSCSSMGGGDGSSTSGSTTKSNTNADIDSSPPNKRRLRDKNTGIPYTSLPPLTTEPSTNQNCTSNGHSSPVEMMTTREVPTNSIKQFLEIRRQIDKRHETMLNECVLPKVPKDFSDTIMAKKNYLIAPSYSSYSITTPESIGIKRSLAPNDLDSHLADVFTKHEDERYKMKLRHQVERDKLILSYEQEVLRLCGNATRSSVNQDIPFSYCLLLRDNEVYNNPSMQLPEKFISNDFTTTELGKRSKHRWNGRSFIKWLEDSNLKYKRLSSELNQRQRLEVETLYSMQRMVWLKHLPKDVSSGCMNHLLTERYLPKVEINPTFWTHWETNPF